MAIFRAWGSDVIGVVLPGKFCLITGARTPSARVFETRKSSGDKVRGWVKEGKVLTIMSDPGYTGQWTRLPP